MGFFRTDPRELEARRRAQTRKAVRALESTIEKNNERSARLEQENDSHWRKACDAMKSGARAEAKREIELFRLNEIGIVNAHRMNLVCQQAKFRAENSVANRMMQSALKEASELLGMNFDARMNKLDAFADALDDQAEIEKIWDRFAARTFSAADRQAIDEVESVDAMMSALEAQATRELGGVKDSATNVLRHDAEQRDAEQRDVASEFFAVERETNEVKIDE